MNNFFYNISAFSIIVPLLLGFVFYRSHDASGKLIFLLVLCASIPQMAGTLHMPIEYKNAVYNSYAIVEDIIWGFVFYLNIKNNKIVYSVIIFLLIYLLGFLYLCFSEGIYNRFFSEMVCLSNLIQISWVLAYFFELYKTENLYKLELKPLFWFSMSILVYAPCTYYYFALETIAVNKHDFYYSILKNMHGVFNAIYYMLIAIGLFITSRKKTKLIPILNTKFILLIIGGTIILTLLVIFIIIFIVLYQKRYYRHLREKNALQVQFSQTLMQAQIEIGEQTHRHIGKELHDNLGQVASLIKINLNTIKILETEKAETKIEETKELVRQMILDIKSLSVSLGADRIVQTGFIKAVETEIDRLNKTGHFKASIELIGNIPSIDKDNSIILYRMVQEILNNMVKHSNAAHINCCIKYSENLLTLVLYDDGVGFNVEEKMHNGGAGLNNLQNRARLINADLSIQSNAGNGTKFTIHLPL